MFEYNMDWSAIDGIFSMRSRVADALLPALVFKTSVTNIINAIPIFEHSICCGFMTWKYDCQWFSWWGLLSVFIAGWIAVNVESSNQKFDKRNNAYSNVVIDTGAISDWNTRNNKHISVKKKLRFKQQPTFIRESSIFASNILTFRPCTGITWFCFICHSAEECAFLFKQNYCMRSIPISVRPNTSNNVRLYPPFESQWRTVQRCNTWRIYAWDCQKKKIQANLIYNKNSWMKESDVCKSSNDLVMFCG